MNTSYVQIRNERASEQLIKVQFQVAMSGRYMGHAAEMHLHKLLVLQKRALRLTFFAQPRTHAVPLFLETKQLPISFLLFEQMSLLMYDVHNNLAPDNMKNMFTKLSSVHGY